MYSDLIPGSVAVADDNCLVVRPPLKLNETLLTEFKKRFDDSPNLPPVIKASTKGLFLQGP